MARPKYTITKQDYYYASRYLIRAMDRGDVSSATGYDSFRTVTDAETLQAWCDNYLPQEVFVKMQRAIRAARKRSRDYRSMKRKVGIDLDRVAHIRLSALADDMNMSLSDAIIFLEDKYWDAKKAGYLN